MSSYKTYASKSRFQVRFKALQTRSSKLVCEERLACRGVKPFAIYTCKECCSNQCEACEVLLHEDFRLTLHNRNIILGPSEDELCEGNCHDRNLADLRCTSCERNFCYLCDYLVHSKGKQSHSRTKFVSPNEEFSSCQDIPDEYYRLLDEIDFNPGASEMLSLESNGSDALPDVVFSEHEIQLKNSKAFLQKRNSPNDSFLLLNDKELLQAKDVNEFIDNLGCNIEQGVKIVSIFGNTGDGKSFTLNHTFFNGEEVFQTSAAQVSCTVGVWAAYCPLMNVIAIDTEGFLGQASNPNRRARMLLKVLAISDVVIYRTRAERLHNDMFAFLGDASSAYSKHFSQELEDASTRLNIEGSLSILGPAAIIFHETHHTEVLSKVDNIEPELTLRARFSELGLKVEAFSSLEYIGLCSGLNPTNFAPLRSAIEKHILNSSVRVARSPAVIYKLLKVLNDKFCGNIDKTIPNTFPDQYFTCLAVCKSCKNRCSKSMNHDKDDIPHFSSKNCTFQHQYENRVFLCKVCYERGEEVMVTPKTKQSNDSSWIGLAKYAWAGYILECPKCGVIYRSRQYWYGNQDPWDSCVRTEICHVWPEDLLPTNDLKNTAQYVIDNLATVSDVVTNIGAKPSKLLANWVADQIAPSYWIPNSKITLCGICKKVFEELETKHHCRMCGGGFCDKCSSKTRPVATWGSTPVRVCNKCFGDDSTDVQNVHKTPEVTVRKIVEVVHSTLETVASAVNYPLGILKDSARPSYWIPDHLLTTCNVCKEPFGPKLSIHHCRSCGEGVCHPCSDFWKPVPTRGWNYDVRICKLCNSEL